MKIEKTTSALPASKISDASTFALSTRQNSNKTSSAGADETSVNLGSTSTQLRNIESSIATSSVVDPKKVAEIKQAISEGRFQVNSGAVADGLINTVQDLISASKR